MKSAGQFAQDWLASWNAHDLEAILAHYADDFEMRSPRIIDIANEPSGCLSGKAAVGRYWQTALRLIPDLHFTLLGVYEGAGSVVLHYRNQANGLAAETFFFASDGRVQRAAAHYLKPAP